MYSIYGFMVGDGTRMRYFVATEVDVVNVPARHLDLAANMLWFKDIPKAYDPTKPFSFLENKIQSSSLSKLRLLLPMLMVVTERI